MLDIKYILANQAEYAECLKNRHFDFDLNILAGLDERRRKIIGETETLKAMRNRKSKSADSDSDFDPKAAKARIKELDSELAEIEKELHDYMMTLPNKLSSTTPIGNDENDNPVVRTWGEPKKFTFEPKPHWDIAEALGIMDFEKGVMLAQSRFTVLKGLGARMERALVNFMLDIKYILANQAEYAECLKNRHFDFDLNILAGLDERRRK
ncbi:MAG: hypothetical protein IJS42_03785, partial [Synergistaceae bacterium]|nr:hypothetical protein [Synergistaceae bacterium]